MSGTINFITSAIIHVISLYGEQIYFENFLVVVSTVHTKRQHLHKSNICIILQIYIKNVTRMRSKKEI